MMPMTDIAGVLSHALLFAAAGAVFAPTGWSEQRRRAVIALLFVAAWLPIGGIPLAGYTRGVAGDLSIVTCVALLCAVLGRAGVVRSLARPYAFWGRDGAAWPLLWMIIAAVFYPMVLGATAWDPYRHGYASLAMVAVVLAIGWVAWWRRAAWVASALALALLCWSAGWYESTNLWDYVIDPFFAVYALLSVWRGRVAARQSHAQ